MLLKSETYSIIGLCMEVYNQLGFGFSEIIFKDAIEFESTARGIPFAREKEYKVFYKGRKLAHNYFADFVMFDKVIVEIKSSNSGICNEHIAQILNYMKIAGIRVGLIINFGKESLEYKRIIL